MTKLGSAANDVTAWSGPALLVPIAVQALPLTQQSQEGSWSWIAPNYSPLLLFGTRPSLFVAAPPNPIDPPGPPRLVKTGMLVGWSLPDALTRGGSADPQTGTMPFPPVPNRWLVLRTVAGTPAQTESWIVASDYVGGSGSAFVADGLATTIGMCWPLADWPGEAALPPGLQPPLTAVGLGNPTFAAYLPNVQHVFSFFDPLDDVGPGPITYAVFGWYAPERLDPLADWKTVDDWIALTGSLGWSVGDDQDLSDSTASATAWAVAHGYATDPTTPSTFLPSRVICHGLVSGVTWPGLDGIAPEGLPQWDPTDPSAQPGVTVAHTAGDALAITVGTSVGTALPEATQVAEALTALLGNLLPLLDEADGADQLALRVQSNWFEQLPGGSRWQVAASRTNGATDAPSASVVPTLSASQAELLDALNTAQQTVDANARQLASLQWDIYALWWKLQYVTTYGSSPIPNAQEMLNAALTAKESETAAAISAWQAANTQADTCAQSLAGQLGAQFFLQQVPESPFWRPNNPLVMLQGAGRSFSHGEDGRFTDDGTLYCRFTGQSISTILVAGETSPVTAAAMALPGIAAMDTPAELNDMATEAFFLDPGNASAIALAANPTAALPASVVAAQQTLMWNGTDAALDQQTLAEVAGLQSAYGPVAVPSKLGVEYWSYPYPQSNPTTDIGPVGAPWAPLFLDWAVTYYPTTPGMNGWTFPPVSPQTPLDQQTAAWTGTVPLGGGVGLQGRTLLTPQATDTLAARLEQLLEDSGDSSELQPYTTDINDAVEYLAKASVLSQALSGFNDLLQQRDPSLFVQPDLTTLGPWLNPAGAPPFAPTAAPSPGSAVTFAPLRAGFLVLDQLWVVDDFGQRYDVLGNLQAHPSPTGIQLGPDLAPSPAPAYAQLRPRLTQPSRLRLRFLDALDDSKVVDMAATANPVCGWLIPNRLDRSVMVYDASGLLLGELLLTGSQAIWMSSPDLVSPESVTDPPPWSNPHLEALVNGILDGSDPVAALSDLLTTIDSASWAIVPSGSSAVELSALIGFPIAVLRAGLLMELDGNPVTSQLWATTGQDDDGGVNQLQFQVELGSSELLDDGVIAYFLDAEPAQLSSPYGPSASGYVTTAPVSVSIGQQIPFTILVHPQANVHAFSGILPPISIALPATVQLGPLQNTEVTFRCGPLVSSPSSLASPLPAFTQGDWAWMQYDGAAPAQPRPIVRPNTSAQLVDVPAGLRDGWLRLTLAPPSTTLTYALSPTALEANGATGGIANLTVTAYNANSSPVPCSSITVGIPSGADPNALTGAPGQIQVASEQPDWTFVPATGGPAGSFVAAPTTPGATVPAGQTLTFTLTNIAVSQSGLALIGIDEIVQGVPAATSLPLETFNPPPRPD